MSAWTEDDGLVKDVAFADFSAAMGFVTRVALLAESRNHHPDILVHGWRHVRLTLKTHDAGGAVTDADRGLADAIDELL
jgi:4a-hydroxytetrahydrobiopterin dehydratase